MARKKKLLVAVLVIVSIPVFLVVGYLSNQLFKGQMAKGKIVTARQSAEITADAKVSAAVGILKQTGAVAEDGVSSKIDVCYVTHSDSGWFPSNWYQDCYLRYVNGFKTSHSMDEVKRRVMTDPASLTYFGSEYQPYIGATTIACDLFEKDYRPTMIYRPANTRLDDYSCELPNPLQGIWSVKGPIVLDDELSVKTYKTFEAGSLDNSQNQVWIMFDEHYYHEELGCGIDVLFCGSPRLKPVHPAL